MVKKILSKSQANLFKDCPYKWKMCYIDKIRSAPSPAQARGINIHTKIENFYKNITLTTPLDSSIPMINEMVLDEDLVIFSAHEKERIKKCINEKGEFDIKYFKPLYQELRMDNAELGLKGIVDAVFINPGDDGIVILDWKTGKYYPNKFDDYRFELAVYTELLKATGKVDDVKYWGIYFVDQDKTFFEEVQQEHIDKMYETMDEVRKGMEHPPYLPKKNDWCYFCQFKNSCKEVGK